MTSKQPQDHSGNFLNPLGVMDDMNLHAKQKLHDAVAEHLKIRRHSVPFPASAPGVKIGLKKPTSTDPPVKLRSVQKVFLQYTKSGLPPGQLFSTIEKKAKTMNLRQFNIFLDDFGLLPGVFSSRNEVHLLFHRLNLMSHRNESRVQLSAKQFAVFIQGVLDFKMPTHHRGMSREQALHDWRQRRISGDHSNWLGLQVLKEEPESIVMDSINEERRSEEGLKNNGELRDSNQMRTMSTVKKDQELPRRSLESTKKARTSNETCDLLKKSERQNRISYETEEPEEIRDLKMRKAYSMTHIAKTFQSYANGEDQIGHVQFEQFLVDYGIFPHICTSEERVRAVLKAADLPGGDGGEISLSLPEFQEFIEAVLQHLTKDFDTFAGDALESWKSRAILQSAVISSGSTNRLKSQTRRKIPNNEVSDLKSKIEVLKEELDERLHYIQTLQAFAVCESVRSPSAVSSGCTLAEILQCGDIQELKLKLYNERKKLKEDVESVRGTLRRSSVHEKAAEQQMKQTQQKSQQNTEKLEELKRELEASEMDRLQQKDIGEMLSKELAETRQRCEELLKEKADAIRQLSEKELLIESMKLSDKLQEKEANGNSKIPPGVQKEIELELAEKQRVINENEEKHKICADTETKNADISCQLEMEKQKRKDIETELDFFLRAQDESEEINYQSIGTRERFKFLRSVQKSMSERLRRDRERNLLLQNALTQVQAIVYDVFQKTTIQDNKD